MQTSVIIPQNRHLPPRDQYYSGKEIKGQNAWKELILSLKEEVACDQATD